MECHECGADVISFAVPAEFESYLPGEESTVSLCPRCLAMQPADSGTESPDFSAVSDAFPTDPEAAIPMSLLVGLLDNLALYRAEIATLLEHVERAGVDPLLVLDRLEHDPDIETELDLAGRRRQLEQLL